MDVSARATVAEQPSSLTALARLQQLVVAQHATICELAARLAEHERLNARHDCGELGPDPAAAARTLADQHLAEVTRRHAVAAGWGVADEIARLRACWREHVSEHGRPCTQIGAQIRQLREMQTYDVYRDHVAYADEHLEECQARSGALDDLADQLVKLLVALDTEQLAEC